MADQVIAKVLTTKDYRKFKHLEGNRDVTDIRARKIRASIDNNGYIFNPIIVNEKFEIIDGGGRKEVLEELGLPVDYIVRPGLSVKDCQALNTASSIWKQIDYINSYADLGKLDYVYLRNLIIRYPEIPTTSILSAVMDLVCVNNKAVMRGELKCSEQRYNEVADLLAYASRFMDTIKQCRTKTRTNLMIGALIFARKLTFVDHERLYKQFVKLYPTDVVVDMQNIEAVLRGLSTIYNHNFNKTKRIYFETEYKKYMSTKIPFYETRYCD